MFVVSRSRVIGISALEADPLIFVDSHELYVLGPLKAFHDSVVWLDNHKGTFFSFMGADIGDLAGGGFKNCVAVTLCGLLFCRLPETRGNGGSFMSCVAVAL